MTFEDVKFLAKSLFGIGPILALSTVGYVWCSGFLRIGINRIWFFSTKVSKKIMNLWNYRF